MKRDHLTVNLNYSMNPANSCSLQMFQLPACLAGNIKLQYVLLTIVMLLCRFYRRGDRSFRKAEKQRLKAEKRLLKAEVKEIRKQLRMERRGIQWSSSHTDGSSSPVLLQPRATQHHSPEQVTNKSSQVCTNSKNRLFKSTSWIQHVVSLRCSLDGVE